jgi:hypothetical protein
VTISDKDLVQIAGLNCDGINGFRAQMALRGWRRRALCPDHLAGPRYDRWQEGASLARSFLAYRGGQGTALRAGRLADFRGPEGATSLFVPEGAERREAETDALRAVVGTKRLR